MDQSRRLIDYYLPPAEGFVLESLVATTYQVDFEFFEEELLPAALGVRSPISKMKAFRSELERRLQTTEVSVLYDLRGCERLARLSPRIDPVPIVTRKLHSKISLLMWVRNEPEQKQQPSRIMRVIVGSANLTRPGFRENYECVAAVDFGVVDRSARSLLTGAIGHIREIASESRSPQLHRQLDSMEKEAAALTEDRASVDDPVDMVDAEQVLPAIRANWAAVSDGPPTRLSLVSPFWPEGATAAEALADFVTGFQSPGRIDLVCRCRLNAEEGDWLPEFDSDVATKLEQMVEGRVFMRAALPHVGLEEPDADDQETGDETEEQEVERGLGTSRSNLDEVQRTLHAKMILLDGAKGSVLYIGSSNCTRRGLALGGATNWEAGFVYRLTPKQRKRIEPLFSFFGPETEVLPGDPPRSIAPDREEEAAVPTFLSEVTASGTEVTIRLREGVTIPDDLVILMEIPVQKDDTAYWLLHRTVAGQGDNLEVAVKLEECPKCDGSLKRLPDDDECCVPHVFVEVRWQGQIATFPVRFDDKASLPLLLVGRNPSEGELIEYFLFGREPDGGDARRDQAGFISSNDEPIDTRRILAYFIRRFVQAIPGIEAEIRRAAYSRVALEAALRGPTSPLELAERAFGSLSAPLSEDEPEKTAVAVGFQLTEILAALLRCKAQVEDESLQVCFHPVITRCHDLLEKTVQSHPELKDGTFQQYQRRFVGGTA